MKIEKTYENKLQYNGSVLFLLIPRDIQRELNLKKGLKVIVDVEKDKMVVKKKK